MSPLTRDENMSWRRDTRRRLLDERLAMPVATRVAASAAIHASLDSLFGPHTRFGPLTGRTVSAYWPLRGEPDLRPWLAALGARGIACALPLVVEKGAPLCFRSWRPGCRMEKGFWDIPVPADGPYVTPDLLIAPVVGHDAQCYRLGYGGGYFDRTLALLPVPWTAIGVGYDASRLPSVHPLPHDIPLHAIVTERQILNPLRAS